MFEVKAVKALACQAYDVVVNGTKLHRYPTLWEAKDKAQALAKDSGGTYLGYKHKRKKKSKDVSLFKGKHKAIPKGWNWGQPT